MCSQGCTLSDFQSGTSLSNRSVASLAATTPCQLQLMYSVGSTASVPVIMTGSSLVVFKLLWLNSLTCSVVYLSAFMLSLLPPSFRQTKMKGNTLSFKIHALFLFTTVNCLTSCSVLPSTTGTHSDQIHSDCSPIAVQLLILRSAPASCRLIQSHWIPEFLSSNKRPEIRPTAQLRLVSR